MSLFPISATGNLTIVNSKFFNNWGGCAILIRGNTHARIIDTEITGGKGGVCAEALIEQFKWANGSLYMQRVKISNQVTNTRGAGMSLTVMTGTTCQLTVIDCIFVNNTILRITGTGLLHGAGASLDTWVGRARFQNTLFVNNSIRISSSLTPTASMTNAGGGVSVYQSNSLPTDFVNCTISGNYVEGGLAMSGGLHHWQSWTTLTNITISDNTVVSLVADTRGYARGGGMLFYWLTLRENPGNSTLTNVMFLNNRVDSRSSSTGGALHIEAGNCIQCFVSQSVVFLNNNASVGTGASGATTSASGGAVYVNLLGGVLSGLQVLRNSVQSPLLGFGGGIHINSIPAAGLMLVDSLIDGNQMTDTTEFASLAGAGLASTGLTPVNLNRCNFTNNQALTLTKGQGGGVYSSSTAATMNIYQSLFQNNYAFAGGGIFGFATSIANSEISRNAAVNGGGVAIDGSGSGILQLSINSGVIIRDNYARQGGGIYLADGASLVASYSTFTNNTAEATGGLLYSSLSNVINIDSCSIVESHAADGGALSAIFFAVVTVTNTTVARCTATRVGGAFLVSQNSNLTLQQCTLVENQAGVSGAAVSIERSSVITDFGSTFSGNSAGEKGGAIFVGGSATSNLTGTMLTGNGAAAGGAVYLESGASLSISAVSVNDNIASGSGGGVYLTGTATATLSSSSFVGNQAADGAGLYCWASGNGKFASAPSAVVDATAIEWRSNVATGSGGALSLRQCAITLSNCAINSNMARTGGGVYSSVDCSMQAAQPCATTEASVLSGAAGLTQSNVTALWIGSGSVFFNNTATEKGGALYSAEAMGGFCLSEPASCARQASILPTVELSGVSFVGNSARGGGSVYWSQEEPLGLRASTFANNVASFGADYASMPATIRWTVRLPTDTPSGSLLSNSPNRTTIVSPSLQLQDFYGNDYLDGIMPTTGHQLAVEILLPSNAVLLTSTTQYQFNQNGVATLTTGLRALPPTFDLPMSFVVVPASGVLSINASINIASCPVGYEIDLSNNLCEQCAPQFFSLAGENCTSCLENARCQSGTIASSPGYYLQSRGNSVTLLACRDDLCRGNNNCIAHHQGELCTQCEVGYTLWDGFCQKCDSHGLGAMVVLVIFVGGFWVLWFKLSTRYEFQSLVFTYQAFAVLISGTGIYNQSFVQILSLLSVRNLLPFFCDKSLHFYDQFTFRLVVVPILMALLPVIIILNGWTSLVVEPRLWISRFFNSLFAWLPSVSGAQALEDTNDFDQSFYLSPTNIDKETFALHAHGDSMFSQLLKDSRVPMAFLAVGYTLSFLYISVLESFVSYLDCVELEPGVWYSTTDVTVKCYSGAYNSNLGLYSFFAALYLVILPLVSLFMLSGIVDKIVAELPDRGSLSKISLASHYLGLYGESHFGEALRRIESSAVRASRPYVWIAWNIARRALIVVPAALLRQNPTTRTLVITLNMFVLFLVHIYSRVLRSTLTSSRETVNLASLFAGGIFVLFYQLDCPACRGTAGLGFFMFLPILWHLFVLVVERMKLAAIKSENSRGVEMTAR
eukprot:TRINITY_DN4213_c0_g3_i1.p1 TRINITY_DN4213_c0_g3~~TRINITY_DN4213_c0_g3_i1.p1  ORF type:complete len:1694 (+),score=334.12 TRINITY_DN4213_c0_g3_i1:449-5083(+)